MKIRRRTLIQLTIVGLIVLICLIYPKAVFGAIGSLYNVLLPLIIGAALGYCLNLLCRRLEKWYWPNTSKRGLQKLRRPLALLSAFIIILVIITGVLRLVIPEFVSALNSFFKNLPKLIKTINNWLNTSDSANAISKQLESAQINWQSIQSKIMKYITSGVSGVLSSTVKVFGSLTSGVINAVLALTFAIYLVSGKEKLFSRFSRVSKAFLPQKFLDKSRYVLHVTNQVFSSFIIGQVTEALILGTLCTLGMLLFRFPDALSIGALIGMTALIPMIGAWIGGAVGFVLIAVTSPFKAVLFVIYILVLQQVEGNLIYPRVVGNSIGIPGIVVLAAITIGSGLGGIIGMLLGVPIAATIYRLLRNETWQKEGRPVVDKQIVAPVHDDAADK